MTSVHELGRRSELAEIKAVVLAGGKGVRLQPFTINFPKPLVPLGDKPIIEILLGRLMCCGVTDITLTLGHLAELIKAYFQNRPDLVGKIRLAYVDEREPTGTAGSLAMVSGLDNTFLVMNGDLLTDLDFFDLVRFHKNEGCILTIAAHRRESSIDLGVLNIDTQHRVVGYQEKPRLFHDVSMGIYVYEPRVLTYIQPGKYLDFPDLVLRLIAAGEKVCAMPTSCTWLDIGRPDDYARAQDLFTRSPEIFIR